MKILSLLVVMMSLLQADWTPGNVPFMSEWGENLNPENILQEYPRPQLERNTWLNLNGLWAFEFAGDDLEIPWNRTLSDSILVPFPVESALSGIMQNASNEHLWYKTEFSIPDNWTKDRIILNFGAVDWQANVFLNNQFLGEHKGGYDSFSFDLTSIVRRDSINILIVESFDPTNYGTQPIGKQLANPESIWFTAVSGIWQTVWLEEVNDIYLNDLMITPNIDNNYVDLNITLNKDTSVSVTAEIYDGETLLLTRQRNGSGSILMNLSDVRLWSPSDPFLYSLKIIINPENTNGDSVLSYFGMRKIEVRKDYSGIPRLFLNNESIFHIGVLDQGYWPGGLYTAPSDEALKYDIEYAKYLNLNMIRKHVKIEPARWYYWCDKIGMMVWQDMPNMNAWNTPTTGAKAQFNIELSELVNEHYNSPSVVVWVPFNENWGSFDPLGITELIQNLDNTRVINTHSGWDIGGSNIIAGDINDMHEYPGPEFPGLEDSRASVCGEFGGLWRQVSGHTWGTDHSNTGFPDAGSMTDYYTGIFMDSLFILKDMGLSASVYTELTDVEIEYAGFLTYDRKVEKFSTFSIKLKHSQITQPEFQSNTEINQLPDSHSLLENYPNPFNPDTKISFMLSSATEVSINVYDITGKYVETVLNQYYSSGTYSIIFNGDTLPSGIYFYTLETSESIAVKKMILLK